VATVFTPAQYAVIKSLVETVKSGGTLDSSAFLLAEQAFGTAVSNQKTAKDLQFSIDDAARRMQDAANNIEENIMPFRVPVGCVAMFLKSALPSGWLELDGSEFSADEYPQLAELLEGNLALPDFRGRVPRGHGYQKYKMKEGFLGWEEDGIRELNDSEEGSVAAHTHGLGRNQHEWRGLDGFGIHGIRPSAEYGDGQGYMISKVGETGPPDSDEKAHKLARDAGAQPRAPFSPEQHFGENGIDWHFMPFGDGDKGSFETRMANHSVVFAIFAGIPELLTPWEDVPEAEEDEEEEIIPEEPAEEEEEDNG